MSQRIIRLNGIFDTEVDWSEVDEKPTEFPPGPHDHDWTNILNEPDFAPASHAHSNYALTAHTHSEYAPTAHGHSEYSGTSHTHSNYAPTSHTHSEYAPTAHTHGIASIIGLRSESPEGFNFNNQLNSGFYSTLDSSNAPAVGWMNSIICRHPNTTSNYQLQIAAGMFQNADFYIRTLNPVSGLTQWRKLWHDNNLLISSGNWVPILTVNNGAVLTYTSQAGSFVRQGKMCHLSFDLLGSLAEGSAIPNNAISLNSNTNALPFLPAKAAATPIKFFTGNLAHKIAATAGSNLLVFYRYQVSGANIIEAAYTWTNLLANSLTFQISGNISYEIA